MVIAGVVLLIAFPDTGADGFGMAVGGGLSVVLLNVLFRLGVSGDEERVRWERQGLGLRQHDVRSGRAVTGKPDHLVAVVQAGDLSPRADRVTQQKSAAAPDLEEVIARRQLEARQDRAPRKVVYVLGAVH